MTPNLAGSLTPPRHYQHALPAALATATLAATAYLWIMGHHTPALCALAAGLALAALTLLTVRLAALEHHAWQQETNGRLMAEFRHATGTLRVHEHAICTNVTIPLALAARANLDATNPRVMRLDLADATHINLVFADPLDASAAASHINTRLNGRTSPHRQNGPASPAEHARGR